MSTFKSTLEASKSLGVLREVKQSDKRYICFTNYSDAEAQWLLGVSDGTDVWRVGLSEEEMKELSKDSGLTRYLSTIRYSLESGEVQIIPQGRGQLTICLKGPQQLDFTLSELSVAERRATQQALLFSVWDKLEATRKELDESQRRLEESQKQQVHDQPVYADVNMRGSKAIAKPKKPAGHSLVNPSSKRRKAATGVVFGEDDSS